MAHDEGSTRAVLAALSANVGIGVTKFVAWLLTGASSMLAESIHSVADSGNQVLLLVGRRRSAREPTAQHQFGHSGLRYLYAFIVAIVLFSVGGLFALWEAWEKLREVRAGHPDDLLESQWWWVPLVVLVAGMIMEGASFRTATTEADKVRGSVSLFGFVRAAKAPELPVILLEDFGALLGLGFAFVGIGMTLLTGNPYWDVGGTAAIGLLLVMVAIVLATEMGSLLVGEGADHRTYLAIRDALAAADDVERVIHLRTLYLGPGELLVAAKIAVDATDTGREIATTIDAAEVRVRAVVPDAKLIFVEPDIDRNSDVDVSDQG